MPLTAPPVQERFWLRVNKDGPIPEGRPELGPCWTWTASTGKEGYARFILRINGKRRSLSAMQWAYTHTIGPIPGGLVLDHLCRNHLCVNPTHLEPVTQRENILRGVGITALQAAKTHCKWGHPFEGENLYVRPDGERMCRTCMRRRDREGKARRALRKLGALVAVGCLFVLGLALTPPPVYGCGLPCPEEGTPTSTTTPTSTPSPTATPNPTSSPPPTSTPGISSTSTATPAPPTPTSPSSSPTTTAPSGTSSPSPQATPTAPTPLTINPNTAPSTASPSSNPPPAGEDQRRFMVCEDENGPRWVELSHTEIQRRRREGRLLTEPDSGATGCPMPIATPSGSTPTPPTPAAGTTTATKTTPPSSPTPTPTTPSATPTPSSTSAPPSEPEPVVAEPAAPVEWNEPEASPPTIVYEAPPPAPVEDDFTFTPNASGPGRG